MLSLRLFSYLSKLNRRIATRPDIPGYYLTGPESSDRVCVSLSKLNGRLFYFAPDISGSFLSGCYRVPLSLTGSLRPGLIYPDLIAPVVSVPLCYELTRRFATGPGHIRI